MARIDALPSLEIIRGFKGILDFYVWRGLPCVRAWPKYRPARQTAASLAAALTFGAIVKAYSLLANLALQAYREDALDQPRTARDIMVTGVFGNLHEASMSDFLDALIICRDSLVSLTALIDALHSVATDAVDVHVHASVLPPDAANATNQGQIYTRLGIIDDLQDALESKALDRLLVRGMDQLHSFNTALGNTRSLPLVGNDGYTESQPCAAGQIWHVTTCYVVNITSATTRLVLQTRRGAADYHFHRELLATAANEPWSWSGHTWLLPTDTIRAFLIGGLNADSCRFRLTGEIMTLET